MNLITDALREIADEAGLPRQMTDVAWRAGRRRRLARLSASTAAGVAAITAAVLFVPLATAGRSPHAQLPVSASSHGSPALIHLRNPLQLRQVAAVSHGSCPKGSHGLPGSTPGACYYLTRTGMTITAVRSARAARDFDPSVYLIDIRLTAADTARFAGLTRELYRLPAPHSQLAVILDGHVLDAPVVDAPITGGMLQIPGFSTRAQADATISRLTRQ